MSLTDFCTNSQEKILKLKEDNTNTEREVMSLTKEIEILKMQDDELHKYNNDLTLRIKGMKERINAEQKKKGILAVQTKDANKEKELLMRNIEILKQDNNYKVRMMENDIEHLHVVKDNNINVLRKKIENALSDQQSYEEQLIEIRRAIDNYNDMTDALVRGVDKDEDIIKQSNDMTKFLASV